MPFGIPAKVKKMAFKSEKYGNGKESLLRAAKELFGEYGYAETTFKKISERAGVAPGLLAHHFGNKEQLFIASGLDVLENLLLYLDASIAGAPNGYAGVLSFCRAYLEFSIAKDSFWLVLVRCSPYSDIKASAGRELILSRFTAVHDKLEKLLARGIEDGSIVQNDPHILTHTIMAILVGVNRTRVLTPYSPPALYDKALEFVSRAIRNNS